MLMPPNDPARQRPLDHPTPDRPWRVYVALTNHCNRSCPWCSTCSSPRGSTWLSPEQYAACFPAEGPFQVQLEGGEPTIHPQFWDFVRIAREHPRCTHLVLCTNGVVLPRSSPKLRGWVERLAVPLTLKLSINHHLLDHDPGLIALAVQLRDLFPELGGERLFVINVRLRRGREDDDRRVREAVEQAGLLPHANVFFLQRYGFAAGEQEWELPAPVWDRFTLVNPDGRVYGPDLLARSEGMRVLS
jgi:MoaA/NifB/PqqE/SkfB family radical SAM enzyme